MRCSCVICTDLFDSGVGIVTIQCGHVFHSDCLLKWIDRSKTCPECRQPVSRKNVVKLYFNVVTNDGPSAVGLQNSLDSLKAKIKEKDIELGASKKKIKDLQLHAADVELTMSELHQKNLKLEFDLSISNGKVQSLRSLETKVQRLTHENESLLKDLEHLNNVKTIVTSCQKEVDDILREMQVEVASECGKSAAARMATYCSVIKRELRRVIEEKNQLRSEVTDSKRRLGLTTATLRNCEKKLKNLEEQVKKADELNSSLLVQNRHLQTSSVSTPKAGLSNDGSLPNFENNSETVNLTPISITFPEKKRKKMSVVVVNKEVPSCTLTVPSYTSAAFPLSKTIVPERHELENEDSVSRIGYNGLGGRGCFIFKTDRFKMKEKPYRKNPK